MKQLDFTPKDAGLFQVVLVGLALSEPPRTAADTNVVANLFDKLKSIGEPDPDPEASRKGPGVLLRKRGGAIVLEEAEHAKLVATTEAAPILPVYAHLKREAIAHVKGASVYAPKPELVTSRRKKRAR